MDKTACRIRLLEPNGIRIYWLIFLRRRRALRRLLFLLFFCPILTEYFGDFGTASHNCDIKRCSTSFV